MHVPLPSGKSATFRDTLLRGDIRGARKGMVFLINADGSRRSDGSFLDIVTGNIIRAMLVAWDYGELPRNAQSDELAQQMLDQLPEDDYAALERAVGPWVERVMRMNRQDNTFIHTATGVRVTPVTEEDGARLAASGEFTAEGAGPKPAPISSGTTSSPAISGAAPSGPGETTSTPLTST